MATWEAKEAVRKNFALKENANGDKTFVEVGKTGTFLFSFSRHFF